MPKFKWENGSKIAEANVEINGKIYNINPAQFEGKTPLSAQNLNAMQDEIYNDMSTIKELSNENIAEYEENQGYLINEQNKQLFNGIIPRYENLLNYSSEEVVVGTHMGKPLYRRIITGTCNKTYERTDIKGIDKIVNYYGVCRVSGQTYEQNGNRLFPYIGQNVVFAINSYNDQRITFSSNWDNNWYECTLEYTKITD